MRRGQAYQAWNTDFTTQSAMMPKTASRAPGTNPRAMSTPGFAMQYAKTSTWASVSATAKAAMPRLPEVSVCEEEEVCIKV